MLPLSDRQADKARMQPWNLVATRFGVLLVLAWHVATGIRVSASEFERSYWLVTWEFGFVRRGLGGELLRLLSSGPTEAALLTAVHTTSVLPATLLGVLAVRLLATEDARAHALAFLLAASPVGLLSILDKHRPDQFGLALLVGLVLLPRTRWAAAGLSVLAAAAVLVHEGSLVMFTVFALPLIVRTGTRGEWLRAIGFFTPAGLTAALVVLRGRATPDQVAQLLHAPATTNLLHSPADGDYSILPYLDEGLRESWGHVTSLADDRAVMMALWGAIIIVVHALLMHGAGLRLDEPRLAWVPPLVGVTFLYLTGVDWLRWSAGVTLCMLVVSAGSLVHSNRLNERMPSRPGGSMPRASLAWVMAVLYLASRPAAPSVAWRSGWDGFLSFFLWPL